MVGESQEPESTGFLPGHADETTQRSGVPEDPRLARFRTGQILRGRLLQALVEEAGAGAVLPSGTLMGPWRLLHLIASGGMSHVYLAERADGQFEQTVALKLVRHNADLLARLRHERQIIATLRHPHIVSLVDGGETDAGDLWFAMALVEGSPIDQFVAERKLDWRRRLALFDQVCAAIEYAHSRALIHRDLKPNNILVDQHGHPRLLDFGIALEGELSDGANDHVLTPGYASPEQKAGGVITTASDLFQLGLVLRAMFAPSAIDQATTVPMPRRVADDLQRLIDRACSADPEHRHASAAALREDVGAILDGHVLAADRQNAWRRAARYVTRHRAAIAVAAIGGVSLLVVLVMAAWQLRQERNQAIENAQRAEAVSTFLVDTLGQANPYSGRRGEASILDAMDLAAATLDERLADAPAVRRQLRSTIASVYMNLDEAQRCLDVAGSATSAADLVNADPKERALALILRSECHLARDEREPAWALLERADAELAPLAAGQAVDRLRAWMLIDMGQLLSLNGRLAEANVLLEQALALAQSSGEGEQVYRAYRFLGGNAQGVNQLDRAEAWLGQAHSAAVEALGSGHRSTLTVAGQRAVALGRLKRFAEAEVLLEQSLTAARAVKHRDGGGRNGHRTTTRQPCHAAVGARAIRTLHRTGAGCSRHLSATCGEWQLPGVQPVVAFGDLCVSGRQLVLGRNLRTRCAGLRRARCARRQGERLAHARRHRRAARSTRRGAGPSRPGSGVRCQDRNCQPVGDCGAASDGSLVGSQSGSRRRCKEGICRGRGHDQVAQHHFTLGPAGTGCGRETSGAGCLSCTARFMRIFASRSPERRQPGKIKARPQEYLREPKRHPLARLCLGRPDLPRLVPAVL
ncbi:MAG: serine/threonine protein kinase [Ahniella sp.]|nr:serine/threonine protein kinase [Ahniella sp.]